MAAPDLHPSDDAAPAPEPRVDPTRPDQTRADQGADPTRAEGLAIFDDETHDDADAPVRSSRLGVVVLVLAVVLLALDGVAIALLTGDGVTAAASIALVTMLASIGVGVVALVAVVTRRGRWQAVLAVLLSVLANPFVFVWLLGQLVPSL